MVCPRFSHPSSYHEYIRYHLPRWLQPQSLLRPYRHLQSLHALTITMGFYFFHQPMFISNNLIALYASLGDLSTARKVFDKMPERNTVSYNSIITACIRDGLDHGDDCWSLFAQMVGSGLRPTQFTFGSLLSASSLGYVQGLQLYSVIMKTGWLYSNAVSGTALLGMFGRLGRLDETLKLFEEMPQRNLVTWNSMIFSLGRHGFVEETVGLFRGLLREGFHPSESSFVSVLCGLDGLDDLEASEQIHGMVIKTGSEACLSVANSLVNAYAKCSEVSLSGKIFQQMPEHDIVSWNTIIAAFGRNGEPERALELFLAMPMYGFIPNQTAFAIVISLCACSQFSKCGELVHAKAIKNNLQCDILVGTALIDFYVKSGQMELAYHLFAHLEETNEVSWNALIAGHSVEDSRMSVYLLQKMLQSGHQPNEFTFSAVLKSPSTRELQQLHCLIVRMGYHQNEYVSGALIASYTNNGRIPDALAFARTSIPSLSTVSSNIIAGIYNKTGQYEEAKRILHELEIHDIVTGNILIEACARSEDYKDAFELFRQMQLAKVPPDNYTAMSLLSCSSKLCNLALGSAIHGLLVKIDFKSFDILVCNVLVNMYAKCGNLESSVKVFNEMPDRNLISWTAIISGLGLHGNALEALDRFREMESLGLKPDEVTFLSVLSACRHGGLVKEGMELFGKLKGVYGIEPGMHHYACVVDLLSRHGHVKEAEQVIRSMPIEPNAAIWRTYLEGCKRSTELEKQAMGLEEDLM